MRWLNEDVMHHNGFGLGEVAFLRWLVCREAILPNPCYTFVLMCMGFKLLT
jgi:hypothetical protein